MSRRRGGQKPKSSSTASKTKDTTQFLEALKLYESKNYKKSNKILDGVLKKSHSHTDSLVLKGLNLHFLGEKDEAQVFINNALSKLKNTTDATSICCHILGIYMKTTKQYADAAKWFQASLDNGSKNYQIYRDLATLQSQLGDFKAVLQSRRLYWEHYMGYRANWTSYAIAQDLNGEYHQAINTLSQFEKVAEGKLNEKEMYENNECIIYKNDIMYRAAGSDPDRLKNVLKHLNDNEKDIYDKYAVLERRASIYMKLGEFKEASKTYRALIKRNPDNFKYYKLLEVALGITDNNKLRKAVYEKFATFYPRCEPPKFIPLTFIENEAELSKKLEEYVIPQLKRGVPATFSNVKILYKKRPIVSKILEPIVFKFLESIEPTEQPIPYIWSCYYLTQHFLMTKDFRKAQEYIEKAITHSPTVVEFYILKGRVMKHLGLLTEAANILEEGRQLDTQDRFINTKTVKYFLRANNIGKAVELASLFTKNDDSPNGIKDLHLVEVAWFIVEQGEAYNRLYIENASKLKEQKEKLAVLQSENDGEATEEVQELEAKLRDLEWEVKKYHGLSFKRFSAISKIYKQFFDDQLDFHSYCMRRGTPRAYLEMLDWGKTIYSQPMYMRAMKNTAKMSFELDDKLNAPSEENEPTVQVKSNKKMKKLAGALSKRKEEEKKYIAAYSDDQDKDPYGEKIVDSQEPIKDLADSFFNNYAKQAKDSVRDSILEFEFYYHQKKLALCLGAMTKYVKQHGKNSDIAGAMSVILALATSEENVTFDPIAKKVALKGLESEVENFPSSDIANKDFDWFMYFTNTYKITDIQSLLLLSKYVPAVTAAAKELILTHLSDFDPNDQNTILQYELQ